MERKTILLLLCAALCVSLYAQNNGANIVGTWQNDKEQQRFVFNADGTVVMSAYGEAAEKAMREEQKAGGDADSEAWTGGLRGTYTIRGTTVELAFLEGGKTHKMSLRIVNANTLRMFGISYARVTGGAE